MSPVPLSLACLLALQAATAPQTQASECDFADHRCKAERSLRRAKQAKNDEHRAIYFFSAYRAYLSLFDEVGEASIVCKARHAFDAGVAIEDQPAKQRATFMAQLDNLTSRERKAGVRCGSAPKRPPADRPRLAKKQAEAAAASSGGTSTADTRADTTDENARVAANTSTESTPPIVAQRESPVAPLDPVPSAGPSADDLLAVSWRHELPSESTAPRPGRGLVIGGSVTLGLGLVLAGVASYTGSRLLETRRAADALRASIDGYPTVGQLAEDAALRQDYQRLGSPTLALALVGGASVVVGAVLLSVGGRRMARTSPQTAVVPVPGGVAFRARF